MRRFALCLSALAALVVAGCGSGRYPVAGKVTYDDGGPVPAGTVIGEATVDGKLVGVQGNIASDGSFSLGGDKPGDGALPGEYKVIVMPRALGDADMGEGKRPDVDGKYGKYDSSGLKYTVKAEKNEYNITVARPKPRSK
jgi:hypothetical protein